jgi:hypothetical protein
MTLIGTKFTESHKAKIATALKGNKNGLGGKAARGYRHTQKWKEIASQRMKLENKKRIKNGTHNLWKGGVTPNEKIKRARARATIAHAIKRGLMKRKPCEKCNRFPSEAHHPDYDFPLNVIWLCGYHHRKLHGLIQ